MGLLDFSLALQQTKYRRTARIKIPQTTRKVICISKPLRSCSSINGTRVSFIEASEVKFAVLLKALEVASVCSVVLSSLNKNLINTVLLCTDVSSCVVWVVVSVVVLTVVIGCVVGTVVGCVVVDLIDVAVLAVVGDFVVGCSITVMLKI